MINIVDHPIINTNLNLVKQEIASILSHSPLPIRVYTKYLLSTQGKYIRAIAVLTAALNQNNIIEYDAIKAATAVELIHLASLVHDDIIDNADIRRGIATLHHKYDKKIAILCGDYIFITASALCSEIKSVSEHNLLDYVRDMVVGELNQFINNKNYDLSIEKYLEIISGKTAKLFEASFLIGAIIARERQENIANFKIIGHNIGLIFQLMDDCGNFTDDITKAKKPILSDLEQGVITLPVIYTLKNNPNILQDVKANKLTNQDIIALVIKEKGLEYTKEQALTYSKKTENLLNTMDLSVTKKQILLTILHTLI